jgi:hypothetical protein
MQKVTNSYFVKSDVIKKLLKDAENFYVENFESGSRSQAIQKLRVPNKENKVKVVSDLSFIKFENYEFIINVLKIIDIL